MANGGLTGAADDPIERTAARSSEPRERALRLGRDRTLAGVLTEPLAVCFRAVELITLLMRYGYFAAAKEVMRLRGVDLGPVRLPNANLTADQRRLQAVVWVLELIASTDARTMLEDVASGKASAWLAREADEALKRMRQN